MYSLDADKTTVKFNGERGNPFRQIGLYAKPSLKEFAIVLINGELTKQYQKTKTFDSKLVLDDEQVSVAPCQFFKRDKVNKLQIEFAAIKLSEEQFLSVLESAKVSVNCGDVKIETDENNISAFRYFASKLASDSDFAHNFSEDSDSDNADVSKSFLFYGDNSSKFYYGNKCQESTTIYNGNIRIFLSEEEAEKLGFTKGQICTPKQNTDSIDYPSGTVKTTGGPVRVRGYYRRDGTYVNSHTRRRPRKN